MFFVVGSLGILDPAHVIDGMFCGIIGPAGLLPSDSGGAQILREALPWDPEGSWTLAWDPPHVCLTSPYLKKKLSPVAKWHPPARSKINSEQNDELFRYIGRIE